MGHFVKGAWEDDDYPDVTMMRVQEIKRLRWLVASALISSDRYALVMSHVMYLYSMLPASEKKQFSWYMGEK